MMETDETTAAAWNDKMRAERHGCNAAIRALQAGGALSSDYSVKEVTDILWTLLSVENWANLRTKCGWFQKKYIKFMQNMARKILVSI